MSMNFGPLNRSGGERRLNVAITRATEETMIFASFGPEMIDLTRTKARAVEDLKHYMEFAEHGPSALRRATREGIGPDRFDSPFEEAVARALRSKGWEVRTQVGVSRFYVDLGIVHPDEPGRFLAGVECDGATYHGSATARDRDRIRHSVLSSLGWQLLRLWSTDFFLDPVSSIARVDEQLKTLLDKDRATLVSAAQDAEAAGDAPSESAVANDAVDASADAPDSELVLAPAVPEDLHATSEVARDVEGRGAREPSEGDGDLRFYDDQHLPALREKCLTLIDSAGPMHMYYLAERVARAYGFARTGKVIRRRVWTAVGGARKMTEEADRTHIVWPASMEPVPVMPYRGTVVEGEPRPWDATPYPERLGLAVDVLRAHGAARGVAVMAEAIGLGRLREQRRLELEELLAEARGGNIGLAAPGLVVVVRAR